MTMLELIEVTAGYGKIEVLLHVSLSVADGEIVGLLGANGAGKTTLARTISGLTTVRSGDIRFEGRSIRSLPPERIVELGITHVPQGRMLFPELTVEENLEMGAYSKRARADEKRTKKQVEELFPVLRERCKQYAGLLSGGEQQMLALGRALMGRPRFLILDEPSLGLAPRSVAEMFRIIRNINSEGIAVLVAEQAARHVLKTAGTVHVIENGRITVQGPSAELARNEDIRRAYLGVG
jgi:branched-chain amino acid transport system ATP-binding protein